MSELWPGLVVEESSITQIISGFASRPRRSAGREPLYRNRSRPRLPLRRGGGVLYRPRKQRRRQRRPQPAAPRGVRLSMAVALVSAGCCRYRGVGRLSHALRSGAAAAQRESPRRSRHHAVHRSRGQRARSAISPDGKLIAFLSDREAPTTSGSAASPAAISSTDAGPLRANAHGPVAYRRLQPGRHARVVSRVRAQRSGTGRSEHLARAGHRRRAATISRQHDASRLVARRQASRVSAYTPGDPCSWPRQTALARIASSSTNRADTATWCRGRPTGVHLLRARSAPDAGDGCVAHPRERRLSAAADSHNARVGYPTPLDERTLLYTATTADDTAAVALRDESHDSHYAPRQYGRRGVSDRVVRLGREPQETGCDGFQSKERTVHRPDRRCRDVRVSDAAAGVACRTTPSHRVSGPTSFSISRRVTARMGCGSSRRSVTELWRARWRRHRSAVRSRRWQPHRFPSTNRVDTCCTRCDPMARSCAAHSALDVLDAGSWSADGHSLAISGATSRQSHIQSHGRRQRASGLTNPCRCCRCGRPMESF